ncbi:hypothetical protein SEA_CHARM_59 [Mycobacterium phage Charm]|nr:hypothetical protein SEA_CHARM_59 [Mycobacterium phage Charm]QGJ88338.1 hypothetical protein SEA_DREAMTEAM1_59 [Mycobacterium phage DreamTeam1]
MSRCIAFEYEARYLCSCGKKLCQCVCAGTDECEADCECD